MNKVAIGRVVLTNREHMIALEPLDKGLMGTLLRYPYEVRAEEEYFDEIQDVKVTKDMLDLAKHIVNQKAVTLHSPPNYARPCAVPMATSSIGSPLARRALRACVADGIQDVTNFRRRRVRRDALWRIPAGCVKRALAGMRIGAVLHPAVLIALSDGAGLLQQSDRPSAQRADRRSPFSSQHHDHRS